MQIKATFSCQDIHLCMCINCNFTITKSSMTISRAVVYYIQAAHAFSAGIECWHCYECSNVVQYHV